MTDPVWQVLLLLVTGITLLSAVLLVALMRQVGGILIQLRPARIGELEGEGPEVGTPVDEEWLPNGAPMIVLFVSPGCSLCEPLLPAVAVLRRSWPALDVAVAIVGGAPEDRFAYERRLDGLARPDFEELNRIWNVPGTPFVVGVGKDRTVQSAGVVNSLDQLENLADVLLHGITERPIQANMAEGNGHDPIALTIRQ